MENHEAETKRPPPPEAPHLEPEPKKLKMSTTTTDDETESSAAVGVVAEPRKPKYKRRKIAIFFAYCGVGYQGMQKNPGAKTIEGELEEALFLAGGVPELERGKPRQYDWARSARTDKGVSAVGQVVSGRFYVDPPGFVERLNSHLPGQIRVFGYKRVTPSFNAKKFCDRRRYVYLIPVFAFDPSSHRDREAVMASLGSEQEFVKCLECSERGRKVFGVMGKGSSSGFDAKSVKVQPGDSSNNSDAAKTDVKCETLGSNVPNGETDDSSQINEGENSYLVSKLEGKSMKVESDILLNTRSDVKNETSACDVPNVETDDSAQTKVEENSFSDSKVESKSAKVELDILMNTSSDVNNATLDSNALNDGESNIKSEMPNSMDVSAQIKEERDSDLCSKTEKRELKSNVTVMEDEGCSKESGSSLNEEKINREEKDITDSKFFYGEKEKERFNKILNYYVGSHNFHNFTTRTKAEDPAAQRYIVSFDANTIVNVDGIDFVKCEVVGQSFMLHQIRKMIGLAVAVMRNCAPESLFQTAFRKDVNINVPMAPEVGLYLDECFFTSYNKKWEGSHEEVSMKAYAEEAEDFKMKHIYSHIASAERKDGAVALWLHSLNHRNYPDLRP